jgi:glycosyltransferase involved in cell wall biosynthesis
MPKSIEASMSAERHNRSLEAWSRMRPSGAEKVALPAGRVVVSCSAPLGVGGLGRHLKEVVDELERRGQPTDCISADTGDRSPTVGRDTIRSVDYATLLARLPLALGPGLRTRASMVEFDRHAARVLPTADHLIAFNGQALTQFATAAGANYSSRSLVSANSHLRHVARQHAKARRRYPIERSWTTHLVRRNVAEYAQADRIYVASEYTRQSFVEEGFREELLESFPFRPDPRYRAEDSAGVAETFNVVYVGSLSVVKGVPLLVDAVRRLPHADIRLILVGGWATRGMRRFLQTACNEDPRIASRPGDPLAQLHAASLYVHPSYEDGFAYAPAEALACGVPVIVSEDTGMKELLPPDDGLVLRTGDLDALTEAIDAAYRGARLSGSP